MDFQQYISPELLVLIPVLYLVGNAIKKSEIKDKYIPILLGVISIVLSAIWVLANSTLATPKDIAIAVFTAVTQGVLIAGASVYANQLVKQAREDE